MHLSSLASGCQAVSCSPAGMRLSFAWLGTFHQDSSSYYSSFQFLIFSVLPTHAVFVINYIDLASLLFDLIISEFALFLEACLPICKATCDLQLTTFTYKCL